jgi:hypothetical protein
MAGMIKKADEAKDAFAALIDAIRISIRATLDKVAAEVAQLNKLTQTGANTPIDVQRSVIRNQLDLVMPDLAALQSNNAKYASTGGDTFVINASGIGDQAIASVVQNAIQELNRYGNSTTYAGAI